MFYDPVRRHGNNGGLSPVAFESILSRYQVSRISGVFGDN